MVQNQGWQLAGRLRLLRGVRRALKHGRGELARLRLLGGPVRLKPRPNSHGAPKAARAVKINREARALEGTLEPEGFARSQESRGPGAIPCFPLSGV